MNRPSQRSRTTSISTWRSTFLLVRGSNAIASKRERKASESGARSSTIGNGSWPDTKQSSRSRCSVKFEELALKFGELEPKFGELGTEIRGIGPKTSSGVGMASCTAKCGPGITMEELFSVQAIEQRHQTLPRPLPHQGYSRPATWSQVNGSICPLRLAKAAQASHSPTTLCDRK